MVVSFSHPVLNVSAATSHGSVNERMHNALMSIDRQYLVHSISDGFATGMHKAFAHDNNYILFRYEDWPAWVTFTAVFIVLIFFDNVILHRNPKDMTIMKAVCYTIFWILCACSFCGWVWWYYSAEHASMWMSGYLLEWMLSFDNLFVFHLIFQVYQTPNNLKHRPLYLGICGAVFFRLAFIFIGEYLMHAMFFMRFIFGAFLVYSGIKTVTIDDDEDDPSQQPLVLWLQQRVPFVSAYDARGSFFVRVPVDETGEIMLSDYVLDSNKTCKKAPTAESEEGAEEGEETSVRYNTVDFASAAESVKTKNGPQLRWQLRATMLFLVVICLETSDILFAVDSVSAIVAQVNDLFLAYTSAVFAMLGLRATFFIIDELIKLFSLLKYGVGIVLVFIGVKLCCEHYYHIPPSIVCVVLVSCIAGSMVASWLQDELQKKADESFQKKAESGCLSSVPMAGKIS